MITKMVKEVERQTLTDRQYEIYTFIRNEIVSGRPAPTVRELMTEFGTKSPNGMRGHLVALKRKGWIDFQTNAKRSITLTTKTATNFYLMNPGEAIRIGDIVVTVQSLHAAAVDLRVERPDYFELEPDLGVVAYDSDHKQL